MHPNRDWKTVFRYRPHHFLCTLGFQGKGYSPQFIQNFTRIVKRLQCSDGDDVVLQVVKVCDDICNACPRREHQTCQQEETIRQLDAGHLDVLGLQYGQSLRWSEAKQRLRERMTRPDFHRVCSLCSWKSLGYCEAALADLQADATQR